MVKWNKKPSENNQKTVDDIKQNDALFKKIIRIAQYESELEMGVNPSDFEQASTNTLSEKDFEYIRKVCVLVEKRVNDSEWLTTIIQNIEKKLEYRKSSIRGIRFDDELFKVGRGILESFLKEKYNFENK
jgi:hypothetical protein